jgi:hypothetical protein
MHSLSMMHYITAESSLPQCGLTMTSVGGQGACCAVRAILSPFTLIALLSICVDRDMAYRE